MQVHLTCVKMCQKKNVEKQNMTENYTDDNLFKLEHPAVFWLQQCIDKAIDDYSKNCGIDYTLKWNLQGWGNVNMKGDYHNLHNHPHSWLSGTYYVSVPTDDPSIGSRNDLNPNDISFFDPRPQANMSAIRNDRQVDPEYRYSPKSGDLLLWPAFLHHLVHPNLCHSERISVSFNVVLKWKEDYLPK